jgi:hypothetical protein
MSSHESHNILGLEDFDLAAASESKPVATVAVASLRKSRLLFLVFILLSSKVFYLL